MRHQKVLIQTKMSNIPYIIQKLFENTLETDLLCIKNIKSDNTRPYSWIYHHCTRQHLLIIQFCIAHRWNNCKAFNKKKYYTSIINALRDHNRNTSIEIM